MPITSNATYYPVTVEFLAHWAQVDNALGGAQPLVLRGGVDHAALTLLKNTLLTRLQGVQTALNGRQIARNTMFILRRVLLEGLNGLNMIVDGYYADTVFHKSRPKVPSEGATYQDFSDPMMDAKDLWARIENAPAPEGLTLPITLPVNTPAIMGQAPVTGMDRQQFEAVYALHQQAYELFRSAEGALKTSRDLRDETKAEIYEALKNYRISIGTRLPAGHVLMQSLPRLSPEKGHTPEPVTAAGEFIPPDSGKVTFTPSDDPDLDHYELRGLADDEWSAEDAEFIASLPKDADPREFLTQYGLAIPGATATFSVYVVLTTGNERGSNPVSITRTP